MKYFSYEGYRFPVHLVDLTGGGTDTWDEISKYHVNMYRKYAPIAKDHFVVEVGSGVGRDAIQIAKVLSKRGRYIGLDIIRDSIVWCQNNISSKYSNFEFVYLDVRSQIHNPSGSQKTTDISLPIPSKSVDRIILHSVFTHMFEDDITHYLQEFRRILKPNGLILTSFFMIDDNTLDRAQKGSGNLKFKYKHPKHIGCYINDRKYPEGAVAYTHSSLIRMFRNSGITLNGPVNLGFWSGIRESTNGQDIFVLRKSKISERIKYLFRRSLDTTTN